MSDIERKNDNQENHTRVEVTCAQEKNRSRPAV